MLKIAADPTNSQQVSSHDHIHKSKSFYSIDSDKKHFFVKKQLCRKQLKQTKLKVYSFDSIFTSAEQNVNA